MKKTKKRIKTPTINGDKLKLFIEGEETNFVRVKD